MDGFNEDDTIPSFNASELIEEVDEEEEEEEDDNVEEDNEHVENVNAAEDQDDSRSSLDSYEGTYRTTKRFKHTVATEFKLKVMQLLKQSCEVAGDFAISGKLDRTPLCAISLKVIFTSYGSHQFFQNFFSSV